ncbi:alginate O-acetyltransferase AlgX-related protein [Gilvimarinus sp. F26214L]|uniref:alginate O-acetyltransferase AlgX-related protein n=1 Tax=Gilvimarinus sp. DZF01 TaxID=3461371 RepID=UPI004046182C
MNAKFFGILFLSVYASLTAVILSLAGWLEPFEGDLTRIGGTAENHFGWNAPQPGFSTNLSSYDERGNGAPIRADVLIFGDSFSQMGNGDERRFSWQNYLAAATGLRLHTLHVGQVDARDWLRQNPHSVPDYVVFQRVERRLGEHRLDGQDCKYTDASNASAQPLLLDSASATERLSRPARNGLELKSAIHWLKTRLRDDKDVLRFKLAQPGLFSSADDQHILVYGKDYLADVERREATDPDKLLCYLEDLKRLVEANGRSRFILAIVPDKYTAYQAVMVDASRGENLFQRLELAGARVVRFDRIYADAVAAGIQDLYLPNDTHWGSEGNRLFASVIAGMIRGSREHATGQWSNAPQH